MSLVTYILQSCDGSLRYRITFDNPTYLDVGETWNVECSGIQNGCYQVLDNTDENLETFNGDECIFAEYPNCEECENSNSTPMAGPPVAVYIYTECASDTRPSLETSGGSPITTIYYPQSSTYSGNQSILFRDDSYNYHCFERGSSSVQSPTDEVTATTGFTNCTNCVATCETQDIVILADQSGSVTAPNFTLIKDGIVEKPQIVP